MKRFAAIVVCAILVALMIGIGNTEETDSVISQHCFAVSPDGESFYLSTPNKIEKVDLQGNILCSKTGFYSIHKMCVNHGKVYVLDETKDAPTLYCLSEMLEELWSKAMTFKGYYTGMTVQEPYVYFITAGRNYENQNLCAYHIITGESEVHEEIGNPSCADNYEDGIAFVCERNGESFLCILNQKEGIVREVGTIGDADSLFMVDSCHCIILRSFGNEIMHISWADDKFLAIPLELPEWSRNQLIDCVSGKLFLADRETGNISLYDIASSISEKATLTIACFDDHLEWDSTVSRMREEYPRIQVQFVSYPSVDSLVLAVMSEENAPDVLIGNPYIVGQFRDERIAEDLSGYLSCGDLSLPEGFNQEVFNLTKNGEAILSAPTEYLAINMMDTNVDLLHQLGLPVPDRELLWEDLESYAAAAESAGCYLLTCYTNPWIHSYLASAGVTDGKTQALQSPIFENLCRKWKDWTDRGLINNYDFSASNVLFSFTDVDMFTPIEENHIYFPVPQFDKSLKSVAEADGAEYLVFKTSKQKDWAVRFLSLYYKEKAINDSDEQVLWIPNMWLYPAQSIADDFLQKFGISPETHIVYHDDDMKSLYYSELENVVYRGHDRDLNNIVVSEFSEYLSGRLSYEEFNQKLINKISIALYE